MNYPWSELGADIMQSGLEQAIKDNSDNNDNLYDLVDGILQKNDDPDDAALSLIKDLLFRHLGKFNREEECEEVFQLLLDKSKTIGEV